MCIRLDELQAEIDYPAILNANLAGLGEIANRQHWRELELGIAANDGAAFTGMAKETTQQLSETAETFIRKTRAGKMLKRETSYENC